MFSSHVLYSEFFPISHSLLMSQRSQVLGLGGLPEKHTEGKLLSSSNIVSESEIWEDLDIFILDIHIIPSSICEESTEKLWFGKATALLLQNQGNWSTYLHQGKAPTKLAHSQSWGARHIPRKSTHEKYSSSPLSTGTSLSVPLLLCVKSVSWLYLGVPPKAQ